MSVIKQIQLPVYQDPNARLNKWPQDWNCWYF